MSGLPRANGSLRPRRWRTPLRCTLASGSILAGCSAPQASPPPPPQGVAQTQPDRTADVFIKVGVLPSGPTADEVVSGDGSTLVTASPDPADPHAYLVRAWDLTTLQPVGGPWPCTNFPFSVSFDGRHVMTAGRNEIRVWDVATSKLLWAKTVSAAPIGDARMDRDGKHVVTASNGENALRMWCVGEAAPCWIAATRDEPIYLDFDPTGTRIVTCGARMHLYDAASGRELVPEFIGQGDGVTSDNLWENFDPAGARFLFGTTFGAEVIDTASGITLLEIDTRNFVDHARWSADSGQIILISRDGAAEVYDAGTGKLQETIAKDGVEDCRATPGGRWVLVERRHKPLEVWDLAAGRSVQTLGDDWYLAPQVSSTVVTAADDESKLAVWRLRDPTR